MCSVHLPPRILGVYVLICFFAAHLQQVWDLQQQPNVSGVAVQNLPRAARGERKEASRSENKIMGPISENMSFFFHHMSHFVV